MTIKSYGRRIIVLIPACIALVACAAQSDDAESGDDAFTLNPFAKKSATDPGSPSANGAAQISFGCSRSLRPEELHGNFSGNYDDWSVDVTVSPHFYATLALGSAFGATVKSKATGTERKLTGGGAAGPRLTYADMPNMSDSPKTYRISFKDLDPSGPHGFRWPGVPDVSVELECNRIADAAQGERTGRNQLESCIANEPCLTDASKPGYADLPPVSATCNRSEHANLGDPTAGGVNIGKCPNR